MWRLIVLLICAGGAALRAEPPARIVSTSPGITETLFALGLGERVVGVSTYCRYPEGVRLLPKVGTFLRPDPEIIARLRPDLVVVHDSQNGIDTHLTRLGIRFVTAERGSVKGVWATIRTVGEAAGVSDRANALVRQMESRLEVVRRSVRARRPQRVLMIVGRQSGTLRDLVAVGADSYLTEVIAMAGGVNVLSDATRSEYPRISMETVIRLAPDVIVDAAEPDAGMGDSEASRQRTRALWARQALVAAMGARVHPATTDLWVVPGPRIVDAVELLASWLHGPGPLR
jgi:iron complex transport system substrate-binding protein